MKRIGILYDKNSKKLFLLPEEIKTLTSKGVTVNVLTSIGNVLKIDDTQYSSAGANICQDWKSVIINSDILLKVNAFNKSELSLMKDKIGITFANFLNNVDMLYNMLINNVTGLEWCSLMNNDGYVFFPKLEEEKAKITFDYIKQALAKGFPTKKKQPPVVYPKNPKMFISNATFGSVALAKLAIKNGYIVTIADNDEQYLEQLKQDINLKGLRVCDGGFNTLEQLIKQANIYVNSAVEPCDLTKAKITKDMAQTMPAGSILVDMACEYGYAFYFIKKYADKELKWNQLKDSYYMAHEDLTNLFALEASKIISTNSVNALLDVVNNGTNKSNIWKITNCDKGKVTNSNITTKLNLY